MSFQSGLSIRIEDELFDGKDGLEEMSYTKDFLENENSTVELEENRNLKNLKIEYHIYKRKIADMKDHCKNSKRIEEFEKLLLENIVREINFQGIESNVETGTEYSEPEHEHNEESIQRIRYLITKVIRGQQVENLTHELTKIVELICDDQNSKTIERNKLIEIQEKIKDLEKEIEFTKDEMKSIETLCEKMTRKFENYNNLINILVHINENINSTEKVYNTLLREIDDCVSEMKDINSQNELQQKLCEVTRVNDEELRKIQYLEDEIEQLRDNQTNMDIIIFKLKTNKIRKEKLIELYEVKREIWKVLDKRITACRSKFNEKCQEEWVNSHSIVVYEIEKHACNLSKQLEYFMKKLEHVLESKGCCDENVNLLMALDDKINFLLRDYETVANNFQSLLEAK